MLQNAKRDRSQTGRHLKPPTLVRFGARSLNVESDPSDRAIVSEPSIVCNEDPPAIIQFSGCLSSRPTRLANERDQ